MHGLSEAFLADKPRFAERAAELLEFIEDCPLVAHNAGFETIGSLTVWIKGS